MLIHITNSSFGLTFYFILKQGIVIYKFMFKTTQSLKKKFSGHFGFVFSYIYSYHIAVLNHIELAGHKLVAS